MCEQGFLDEIQPPQNDAAVDSAFNENAIFMAPPSNATELDNHPHVNQEPIHPPTAEDDSTIPKTRSLAHHKFIQNKVVFVSFDIETGGNIVEFSRCLLRW